MKPFFISTPIYYVNAKPHLGHAYTTLVADSMRRFYQLRGYDTWFLTGTDEHGDKIVKAAAKQDQSPQEFVDSISAQFRGLWKDLHVVNDQFIRTTDPAHKAVVQTFLQRVFDKGDIYFGEYGGYYCYGCERFYTEKELENGLCPQHQVKPDFISEKNYFFKMSRYQEQLKEHILANPDFIRPERYRSEVLAILDSGALEDLCISRPKSRLAWGIELPFDHNFVCYVWFDALINYISALNWPDGEQFARYWPGVQHLVAKDILKPHAIFWPTMLMAADLPLYTHLNVHGYWLVRDTKMSKSLGNVIDPLEMSMRYGLEQFRYFLLREMHFGSDAGFSEEAFITRINADLANDLGNLFSRVLSMNAKYFAEICPAPANYTAADEEIRILAQNAQNNFVQLFAQVRFSQALESLWELVRALNKYVDTQAPWVLFKQQDMERLGTVMYVLLECMRKVAVHLWAVMPESSVAMLRQLGQEVGENAPTSMLDTESTQWGLLTPGIRLAASSVIFPRIEVAKHAALAQDVSKPDKSGKKAPGQSAEKGVAEYTDFQKLDIRIGTIIEARQHPDADKLLCLNIDLGESEPRQIISGIAQYFTPESLAGQQVCVVANLAPRKLRGLVSHGMVLTAEGADGRLALLKPAQAMPAGSTVA